ncbi:DUF6256 family protein [Streptomyces halobius]|uniref:Secreted protein with PEP-CTERM sorting signal n=1 Tax=Streptomyces halobius TaxID=2879846 RepID=A0ABY4MJK3_9ACTN|nr:DUF6256 family protein [Streptomyces halobius]UQA97397.1 hypothetical protein K9S39_41015 [Streptomyces halobius]
MLPTSLNLALMLTGYLLVMGYLGVGLLLLRRPPEHTEQPPRRPGPRRAGAPVPVPARRGWPGLIRQVVGTAIGGYVLLMVAAFGYYYGVVGLGGRFLLSAVTGSALMVGVSLPLFFIASWVAAWWRKRSSRAADRSGPADSER